MTSDAITFRQAAQEDTPFMEEMCYLAAFSINGEVPERTPTFEAAKQLDWFADYTKEWGREGDFGLIATDSNGNNIGAAWYRTYQNETLPKHRLSIALTAEYQQRGIGKRLIRSLMLQAAQEGMPEIGLTVDPLNTIARHVYEGLGFMAIGSDDGLDVMTAPITHPKQAE